MTAIGDDEAAFLAAIRAAPDDDGPRQVYADWLLQRGDLRGEMINIQCELARGTDRPAALSQRERQLRPKLHDLRELAYYYPLPIDELAIDLETWSRGFVPACRVSSIVEEFAAKKDHLYRVAPLATKLHLWNRGSSPPWTEVLGDPDVVRWGALDGVPTAEVPAIAGFAHLDALRELELVCDEDEEPEVLDPIFAHGRFGKLEKLTITGMGMDGYLPSLAPIDAARWRSAAFAPTLRAFEGEMLDSFDVFPKLDSFDCGYYGPEQFEQIAQFGGGLRELQIGWDEYAPCLMSTLRILLNAPCLRTLERLSLSLGRPADHDATAWRLLDQSPLQTLKLRGQWVDDACVRALTEGPRLGGLRELHLDSEATTHQVLAQLFASRAWPDLEVLDLGEPIRDLASLVAILERLPRLRRLRCGVTDPRALFERRVLDAVEIVELHTRQPPKLPGPPSDRLRILQLHFQWIDRGFTRGYADQWGRNYGFESFPPSSFVRNRGNDALAFLRDAPGFWSWAASLPRHWLQPYQL